MTLDHPKRAINTITPLGISPHHDFRPKATPWQGFCHQVAAKNPAAKSKNPLLPILPLLYTKKREYREEIKDFPISDYKHTIRYANTVTPIQTAYAISLYRAYSEKGWQVWQIRRKPLSHKDLTLKKVVAEPLKLV